MASVKMQEPQATAAVETKQGPLLLHWTRHDAFKGLLLRMPTNNSSQFFKLPFSTFFIYIFGASCVKMNK